MQTNLTNKSKHSEHKTPLQAKSRNTAAITDNRPGTALQKKQVETMAAQPYALQPKTKYPIQRIGTNVDLVDEEDRFFETKKGTSRLRVNPENDPYLEGHFDKGAKASLTDASLGDKFSHALNYVHKGIPYNKQNKIDALNEHTEPNGKGGTRKVRSLGYMLHVEAMTCWEKAAYFHLVLAELGIPTLLEGGYDKEDNEGHAWLIVPPNKDLFKGKTVVIDPTDGSVSNRTTYEKRYNITVPAKAVATPKEAQKPADIEKALKEFFSLENLGGIVKEAVIELVELKAQRVINDRRREAERVEFEKMLKKMFTF